MKFVTCYEFLWNLWQSVLTFWQSQVHRSVIEEVGLCKFVMICLCLHADSGSLKLLDRHDWPVTFKQSNKIILISVLVATIKTFCDRRKLVSIYEHSLLLLLRNEGRKSSSRQPRTPRKVSNLETVPELASRTPSTPEDQNLFTYMKPKVQHSKDIGRFIKTINLLCSCGVKAHICNQNYAWGKVCFIECVSWKKDIIQAREILSPNSIWIGHIVLKIMCRLPNF